MIKIDKDLNNIPISLKPPTADYFPPPYIPIQQSKTTHQRREEVIAAREYISSAKFNNRYKYKDVKDALYALYNRKCAFCEQRAEVPHVEHFRPKYIYYWLAYSWDNLLLACSTCNSIKGNRFALDGEKGNFAFNANITYKTIHNSCAILDRTEKPLLVNPEVEDLAAELIFDQNGSVSSHHPRVAHTIKECGLSREDLKYQRKKLLDDFRKDIEATLLENKDNSNQQKVKISAFISQFLRRMHTPEESFLAFRRYVVANNWLNNIIKELN